MIKRNLSAGISNAGTHGLSDGRAPAQGRDNSASYLETGPAPRPSRWRNEKAVARSSIARASLMATTSWCSRWYRLAVISSRSISATTGPCRRFRSRGRKYWSNVIDRG